MMSQQRKIGANAKSTTDKPLSLVAAQMKTVLMEMKKNNYLLSKSVELKDGRPGDSSLKASSSKQCNDMVGDSKDIDKSNKVAVDGNEATLIGIDDINRALLEELRELRRLRELQECKNIIRPMPAPYPGGANCFSVFVLIVLIILFFIVFVR